MLQTLFSHLICRIVRTRFICLYLQDGTDSFYFFLFVGWYREFVSVYMCTKVQTVFICLYQQNASEKKCLSFLQDATDRFNLSLFGGWYNYFIFVYICRMVRTVLSLQICRMANTVLSVYINKNFQTDYICRYSAAIVSVDKTFLSHPVSIIQRHSLQISFILIFYHISYNSNTKIEVNNTKLYKQMISSTNIVIKITN